MKLNSLLISVVALFGLASQVCAQDAVKSEGSSAKRIADIIDIAPWGLAGSDGKPTGVYPNIFKRLSERSGCPMETRLTPIARAVMEVSRGTASATMMMDRADLNENAVVIGEVTALRIEVWLPLGSPLRSLDDLAGKTVGVLRGPVYHEVFDQDSRIRKHPVTTPRQQLEMLSKGRLDAAIGVRQNFLTAAGQMRISPDSFGPPIDLGKRAVKLWVTSSMGESPCAKQLSQALKDMRRTGEVDRLISQGTNADR